MIEKADSEMDWRWIAPNKKTAWDVGVTALNGCIRITFPAFSGGRVSYVRSFGRLTPAEARILATNLNLMADAAERQRDEDGRMYCSRILGAQK